MGKAFISLKCGFVETVHRILEGQDIITIDNVYTLQEDLKDGAIIFLTLGGDKGKKEIDWEPGFWGMAHVVREPYDFGYDGRPKYFKFDIKIDFHFAKTYKRVDFIRYPNAFDAPFIGPELNRDATQAVLTMPYAKAVSVVRAVVDNDNNSLKDFNEYFPKEFMDEVISEQSVFLLAKTQYGKTISEAIEGIVDTDISDFMNKVHESSVEYGVASDDGATQVRMNRFRNWMSSEKYISTIDKTERNYETSTINNYLSWLKFITLGKEVVDAFRYTDVSLLSKNIDNQPDSNRRSALNKYIDFLNDQHVYENAEPLPLPHNRIVFGAPGTGKSYAINKDRKQYFQDEATYERVTFHPAYSYAQFFGCYKPVGKGKDISYKYIPGPFLRVLLQALSRPDKNFLLVIEEINRANVAAVFGDVFQLLDRENGKSEYPIDISDELADYISEYEAEKQVRVKMGDGNKLYLPENFYIWATMNSADQGVMPLDTAFKRRWQFQYMPIDEGEDEIVSYSTEMVLKSGDMETLNWNSVRHHINRLLKKAGINEDKWLGPFFLSMEVMKEPEKLREMFASKVLMYLFEDAAKYNMRSVFGQEYAAYSELLTDFEARGLEIFVSDGE